MQSSSVPEIPFETIERALIIERFYVEAWITEFYKVYEKDKNKFVFISNA